MSKEDIKVVRTEQCPSLSGSSTLTYSIGVKEDGNQVLRLDASTGTGLFNRDWFCFAELEPLLASQEVITSGSLRSLFKGKSANTQGFVLAVLKAEGLVSKEGKPPGGVLHAGGPQPVEKKVSKKTAPTKEDP